MYDQIYQPIASLANGKILLVCDDQETGRIWVYGLRERLLEAVLTCSAEVGLRTWSEFAPDLIIVDLAVIQVGIDLCRELRSETLAPILLLIPFTNEPQILDAYQVGVDECICKPVSPAIFLAKVKAWLRRSWTVPAEGLDNLKVGDLCLDPRQRQVVIGEGKTIKLTNLEFRLLHLLMNHPGWVMTTEDIIQRVWGYYGNGNNVLLKNLVYRLRRKIDSDPNFPRYIFTETGVGYKFLYK